MNIQDPNEQIAEGLVIPASDLLPPPDTVSGIVNLAGMDLHKDVALIIIAAGCFFIGRIDQNQHRPH